jgi:hypothetical protein
LSRRSHAVTLTYLLLMVSGIVLLSWANPSAIGSVGPAQVTTPAPTTVVTSTTTVVATPTTTATSIFTIFTTTSTSTVSSTTTSTSISSSYTSTKSVTDTNTTTSSSYTGTVTANIVQTETTTSTTTETSTSTTTSVSTTTVAKLPSCLIATATFGSELSPEVELLRNFRDNEILHTASGSGFMIAFNAWYYSFSPSVAGYLSTHVVERTVMKGVLYPLIGILKLSSMTFSAMGAFPELAAFVSGMVASSLIGAFYLGLPLSLVRAKIRRLRGLNAQGFMEKLLLAALMGGIASLLIGELLLSPVLLMLASVVIVLSTLFLSAVFTSGRISRKLQPQ